MAITPPTQDLIHLSYAPHPTPREGKDTTPTMISTHTISNGLRVGLEQLDTASSVSVQVLIPAGSMYDSDKLDGLTTIFLEMLFRGADSLDAKALANAFDRAGMQRGGNVTSRHIRMNATTTGDRLEPALKLLLGVAFSPSLPSTELESARRLCAQSLSHVQDDPNEEIGLLMRSVHILRPYHRGGLGTNTGLEEVSLPDLVARREACCVPGGAIITIAGDINPSKCVDMLTHLTGSLTGTAPLPPTESAASGGQWLLSRPTSQVHLAMAWDGAKAGADAELLDRLAIGTLGGTTSGRLFTEARQRRSLCYSIGARYAATAFQGSCSIRASTTPENVEELLNVCSKEISKISCDLSREEVNRTKQSMISSMVMSGESTMARAAFLARDLCETDTCRPLTTRIAEVESTSVDDIIDHVRSWSNISPSIVAIGPEGCVPFPEWPHSPC
jgi:predicted Zn-dependent peptidase